MPMLLLVLGLVGTWARQPSGPQELSAAHDAGLGANGLAQIEASLLSLAREKSTPDSSTIESIALIEQYLNLMKSDVLTRASATQSGLNQSWYNLVNCTLNLTAVSASTDFTLLNSTHRDCSTQESSLRTSYMDCLSTCETECTSAQATCDMFCQVDTPTGMPTPTPAPTPGYCHFAGPVKGDDTGAEYREWDGFQYYQEWVNHFDGLLTDWTNKRTNCKTKVNTMQNCYQSCETTYGTAYATKKQECTDHQYDLEAAACHDSSAPCAAYSSCFDSLTNTYLADMAAANASEASWYTEYRGIMRVQCLLNAYNASIVSGADLQTGLDSCQQTTFYPCTEQASLCLEYYAVPAKEGCNGTYDNVTLQPGSSGWIEAFYTNMPNMTAWEVCGAQCCASDGPSVPTPDALPSTNCSLCTNESAL